MSYNWQMRDWPFFRCDVAALAAELADFEAAHARVEPSYRRVAGTSDEAEGLALEAVRTSVVENEHVDEGSVLSSVCRYLGLPPPSGAGARTDVRADGVAALVVNVRRDRAERVTKDLLLRWHRDLMAPFPSAGRFRTHSDAMKIVRRTAYGEYEERFEAPPSARVEAEMSSFVKMANEMHPSPNPIHTAALKATLLHPYFESIHPFEDGNGRLGRALVAKCLSASFAEPVLVPVSPTIVSVRKAYYDELNRASMTLDWTGWAKFFLPVLTTAMRCYADGVDFIVRKRAYLGAWEPRMSPRAASVIKRMLRDGPDGVARGLSVEKFRRMTGVSKATATRELAALVACGAVTSEGRARATHYVLKW